MRVAALLVAMAAATGCGLDPPDVGRVSVSELSISGCELEEPFEIRFNFIGYDDCVDVLFLRCQHEGKPVSVSDGLEVQFPGLSELTEELKGGPASRSVESGGVRAALYLNASCKESFDSLQATEGTLLVEELEAKNGGRVRISGSINLVDVRTGDTAAPKVEVELDTTLSDAWPHKVYPVCP